MGLVQGYGFAGGGGPLAEDEGSLHTEAYDHLPENEFFNPASDPLSTFSVDVDTASYANVRRFLEQGNRPPKDAVRIEEMINYFNYDYAAPSDRPFAVHVETASAPWQPKHRLVRIGIKGKDIDWSERPASNLVFLLDVSGSMSSPNKLPLLKKAFRMLVDNLGDRDRVAMVVYAGASGLVLPSTPMTDRDAVFDALDRLQAGGSTNGGAGIELAYKEAQKHFIKGGINRVILATDGDFNVGTSDRGSLVRMVQEKAKQNVFLTVLGFGMGNYKDAVLEEISGKGNGAYAYIDSRQEAKKVMVEQVGGTLMTIAKDVKIQVEFNPAAVNAYRLIGYENRIMAHRDFNDDTKDAGEIGAGHTVTALYEVVPKGVELKVPGVDKLKYQRPEATAAQNNDEVMTVKIRYKEPEGERSSLIQYAVKDSAKQIADASADLKFAAATAWFGMQLRDSKFKGNGSLADVQQLAKEGLGADERGYRADFLDLLKLTARRGIM